jgi:hypothetical protein
MVEHVNGGSLCGMREGGREGRREGGREGEREGRREREGEREGERGRGREADIEELTKSSGAQDPGVAPSIGVAPIAPIEDAWVACGSVIGVDLRKVSGSDGLEEEGQVTLYSLQKRVL